ncbi:hypothetical protein EVAR_82862_1 [Eumeta japonica]|uniref:Uncharacterized protein n=1 Tax=Eumeta variegata TaxID=151549 RepID=A0A4C1V2I3_EUMVA|nr:hypothetical protein EVAR_82862_1 [Eumeta japonica]
MNLRRCSLTRAAVSDNGLTVRVTVIRMQGALSLPFNDGRSRFSNLLNNSQQSTKFAIVGETMWQLKICKGANVRGTSSVAIKMNLR